MISAAAARERLIQAAKDIVPARWQLTTNVLTSVLWAS